MTREEAKDNIDLTKILKDCPIGWKFWSPLFGDVEFQRIFENKGFINTKIVENGNGWTFNFDATFFLGDIKSKEIMLYPSKDQRDWSKFTAPWYKKEKFDPKTLQPFDKVLVRANLGAIWFCTTFSHIRVKTQAYPYHTSSGMYPYCIPYNEYTKNLVGTEDEAPEYYRYWEI